MRSWSHFETAPAGVRCTVHPRGVSRRGHPARHTVTRRPAPAPNRVKVSAGLYDYGGYEISSMEDHRHRTIGWRVSAPEDGREVLIAGTLSEAEQRLRDSYIVCDGSPWLTVSYCDACYDALPARLADSGLVTSEPPVQPRLVEVRGF